MPELPEVEAFKRYFDATSLHKPIKSVMVKSPRIIKDISVRKLEAALRGRRFLCTKRHGKNLFARTNGGFWLCLHFGMTGNLKYFKGLDRDPSHDRFLIAFSNGFHLALDCQRKFCRIGWTKSVEGFIVENGLGPDALNLDFGTFQRALGCRTGAIKCVLMDQHIIAGIGNLYSDELLFKAGIHPATKANASAESELKELYRAMKAVLRRAIECQSEYEKFPDSFLIRHRFEGGKCPRCESRLERMKICGRASYYCPRCQGDRRLQSGKIKKPEINAHWA